MKLPSISSLVLGAYLGLSTTQSSTSAHVDRVNQSHRIILDAKAIDTTVKRIIIYLNIDTASVENNEQLYQDIKEVLLREYIKSPMSPEIMEAFERHNQEVGFMEEAVMSDLDLNIVIQRQIKDIAIILTKYGHADILLPLKKLNTNI